MRLFLKKRGIVYLFCFSLVAFLPSLIKAQEQEGKEEKRVLIVNSFGYSQDWSTLISKNLRDQLYLFDSSLVIKVDYLGSERFNSLIATRFGMQRIVSSNFGRTPEGVNRTPHLVIIIGDEAWMTYRIMTLQAWSETPVILCNVHQEILSNYSLFFKNREIDHSELIPISESSDTIRFTGAIKPNNIPKTFSLINELYPDNKQFVFYSDNSYSDKFLEYNLRKHIEQGVDSISLRIVYDEKRNGESLYAQLVAQGNSEIILLNNLYSTFKSLLSDPKKSKLFRSNQDINPIFVFNDVNPTDSLTLGGVYPPESVITSHVSDLAISILSGKEPKEIPLQSLSDRVVLNSTAIDFKKLRPKTKILTDVYFQNIPDPFLIRNLKQIVIALSVVFLIVIGVVFRRRSYLYRVETERSLDKFKTLYDEFTIVFENMPVGLILFDQKGKSINSNPESNYFSQYLFPDVNSGDISLFDSFFSTEDVKSRILNKQDFDLTIPIMVSENDVDPGLYFRLVFRQIDSYKNGSYNTLLTLIDVSDIHKERIEKERMDYLFEFAMEKSQLGVAEYNMLTKTGYATEAWYKNLRISSSSSFTDPYYFFDQEDLILLNNFLNDVKEGKTESFVRSVKIRFNNNIHWLRYVIKVMEYAPSENRIILAELNWNIDEQKQNETAISTALQKAQESERLKNGFIANMSQEISKPLDAIISYSNKLIDTKEVESKMDMLSHIESNNDTLLNLIGNIIDLSKLESDTVDMKIVETDLKVLINEIVFKTKREVDPDKIEVAVEQKGDKYLVLIDKYRLTQVLECFTSNAVKHTKEGEIKIGYAITGNQLYMYVADTGEGISNKRQEELNKTLSGDKKFFNKQGLSLQISRAIISKMGGKIGFNSEQGSGSTFWFRIPIRLVERSKA